MSSNPRGSNKQRAPRPQAFQAQQQTHPQIIMQNQRFQAMPGQRHVLGPQPIMLQSVPMQSRLAPPLHQHMQAQSVGPVTALEPHMVNFNLQVPRRPMMSTNVQSHPQYTIQPLPVQQKPMTQISVSQHQAIPQQMQPQVQIVRQTRPMQPMHQMMGQTLQMPIQGPMHIQQQRMSQPRGGIKAGTRKPRPTQPQILQAQQQQQIRFQQQHQQHQQQMLKRISQQQQPATPPMTLQPSTPPSVPPPSVPPLSIPTQPMTPPSMAPPSIPAASVGHQRMAMQPHHVKLGVKRQAQQSVSSPQIHPLEQQFSSNTLVEALERNHNSPFFSHTLHRTFGPALAAID